MGCCSSTEVESPRQQQYSRTIRTTTQTSQVQKSQESTQQAITSQGN